VPARLRFAPRHALALALLATVGAPRAADRAPSEEDWSLCGGNSLLEFYVPELTAATTPRAEAPADLSAASISVVEKTKYHLEGDAVVTRADQRIAAQRLDYDSDTGTAIAQGEVRYQDAQLLLAADRAESALDADTAKLDQVRYQLIAARGNGTASQATLTGKDRTDLSAVTFSTCNPGQRDWELSAREMHLDHESGRGTARGMRLKFKGVPLLALPYATFPIDDRRRSGFLYPSIGGSNNGGFDFAVPYYLNLAPNYDATLVPRVIAQRGFMLGGEFRYLFGAHRGSVEGTFLPNDREFDDNNRHSYRFRHWGGLGAHFFVAADIARVSDERYFEDFGDSLAATATSLLPSSAYLTGRGEWWTMSFGGDSFQVTDPLLAPSAEPYRRLPRFTYTADVPVHEHMHVGVRSELVAFDKDDALDGRRYDIEPYVAFPFERAAGFVRPELAWRNTRYDLDRALDDTPSRSTPIASVDAGLFFDRHVDFGGRALRQTLEPRLYYLRVPYRDQGDLPIFDTQELTFGFAELFRTNRFSGADRQMDANNLTVALTSRLLDDGNGQELLRASIGQIRYFDEQRVQLPGLPATDFSGSAYAAELDLSLPGRWQLGVAQQYDPESDHTQLSAVRIQRMFGERGVANLTYRYRRGQLEQLDGSTALPINDRVRLIARWNYSLFDERTLEALGGLEFDSCCYAFRILGRHYVRNVEGDTANALFFELELKGLGSLGRRSEDFLRRAILGYR
jgi:LPS-assembly protein